MKFNKLNKTSQKVSQKYYKLKIVYPTSSFLFSDDSPNASKLWGCILTLPRQEDATFKSQQYSICDKCGSFKTSKGNICPICHPETPYNANTDKFIFSDCLLLKDDSNDNLNNVNKDISPFSSIICFAFDISSSSSIFQQIIYSITSADFQREFIDCGFIIAFLIKDTTIFVTRQDDGQSDNLSFDRIPPLDKSHFFTSESLSNALIDSFSIIQVMVLDLFSTERSLSILFSELSKNLFNDNSKSSNKKIYLDHLFLFYASSLSISRRQQIEVNFHVHCIELNDKKTIERKYFTSQLSEGEKSDSFDTFSIYQSKSRKEKSLDNLKIETSPITSTQNFEGEIRYSIYDSILIAFQNGWTHINVSSSEVNSNQLIEYIKNCIKPILPKSVKISLHISPELEIAWVSSNKILMPSFVSIENKNRLKNHATIYVHNFQSDFMLHVTFQQAAKSAQNYEKAKYFTLQTVFEFSSGPTFIANRSYKKAASLPKGNGGSGGFGSRSHEWSDSINFAPFCMTCLKQRASLFLMNYISAAFYSKSDGNNGNHSSFFRRRLSVTPQNQPNSKELNSSEVTSKNKMLGGKTVFSFNWSANQPSNSAPKFNNADLWDVGFRFVINNTEIFSPSLSIVRQIVELFHSLFIDENSPINDKIRLDIVYLTMTQGFGYFVPLFNALFTILKKDDVLYFPPFLIVPRSNRDEIKFTIPDVADKNQEKAVILPTISVELDDDVVQRIREIFSIARKKL